MSSLSAYSSTLGNTVHQRAYRHAGHLPHPHLCVREDGRCRAASTCTSAAKQGPREVEAHAVARRSILLSLSAGVALAGSTPSWAEGTLMPYNDERDAFTISIPEGWSLNQASNTEGTGPTATRRTLAWFEEGNPATYVTATVTNVGADYTSLGSFGTAEQFGSNLVASMDQSFLKRARFGRRSENIQEAKLVGARDEGNTFSIEYTVKRSAEDERHLLSRIALGYNGRYTRLYTVTGQCSESNFSQEKAVLQRILSSFRAPNARL